MPHIPLSVLDLVPVSSGSSASEALRNTIDLAQRAEELGYQRYWFAEHHLNPGVAGTSPAVVIALVGGQTSRIRIGSAGVQLGHRTALSVVEEFGLLDSLYPGRLDLGLGRSGGRNFISTRNQPVADEAEGSRATAERATEGEAPAAATQPAGGQTAGEQAAGEQAADTEIRRAPNGLPIPRPQFSFRRLAGSPRFQLNQQLLQQPNADSQDYTEQVGDILALQDGSWRSPDGIEPHIVPGEGVNVEIWILGSSPGQSAQTAGAKGLRFAANYHVSPGSILEAVDAYRAAFQPSDVLDRPYVAVSADVVVGEDDATAAELATGYGLWVRSIRSGEGAIAFPTPAEARKHVWTDEDRALVTDRIETQFVGSPQTVAARLDLLQDATGADELVITTITHDHADRVRSYELLAKEWFSR
jgi:alkanesulfonate monooxygenase SsuD/methylene tetrahydromethanopterin reductase-like flavin-dependent oxidoreductase (luciferase family)